LITVFYAGSAANAAISGYHGRKDLKRKLKLYVGKMLNALALGLAV